MTRPVAIFQGTVLSPRPSKPEPLLAAEEVNSYRISEKPWKPALATVSAPQDVAANRAVPPRMKKGWARIASRASFISRVSTLRPKYSGVRPTIMPLMNTPTMM